jgi:hypothetical protein
MRPKSRAHSLGDRQLLKRRECTTEPPGEPHPRAAAAHCGSAFLFDMSWPEELLARRGGYEHCSSGAVPLPLLPAAEQGDGDAVSPFWILKY